MKKIRYYNIDLIKVIALYFVILIHNFNSNVNFMLDGSIEVYLSYAIRLLIEAVPIFVFVNGFLLIGKKFELKKHIKKIIKIFSLIFIWSIIYILLFSLIDGHNINLKHIISNVLITNISSPYTGILWFLQNLICLYFIYPLLKLAYDKDKSIYNYIFIIVAFFSVGVNFINLILQLITNIFKMNNLTNWINIFLGNYNPLSNLYFIFYFMLGGYVHDNIDKIKKYKKILLISALIGSISIIIYGIWYSNLIGYFYSSNFNYNTIFLTIFIVGIYTATINYEGKNKYTSKVIEFCGKNSLGIYFIHIVVTRILAKYIFFQSLGLTLLYGILILIISSIFTYILTKIPYIKKIINI